MLDNPIYTSTCLVYLSQTHRKYIPPTFRMVEVALYILYCCVHVVDGYFTVGAFGYCVIHYGTKLGRPLTQTLLPGSVSASNLHRQYEDGSIITIPFKDIPSLIEALQEAQKFVRGDTMACWVVV